MARPITVDLIPKKRSRGTQILEEIRQILTNLYVATSFFPALIFLALYAVMLFYSSQLEKDLDKVKGEVILIERSIDPEKKQEVKDFAGRLDIIRFILNNHVKSQGILKFIESVTHKEVAFNDLNFSAKEGSVTVNARTKNYRTFAEQMIALGENKNISNLRVSNVKLGINGVIFNVVFNISREIYIP